MYLVKHPTATLGEPGVRQPDALLDRFDRAELSADHQRKISQLADQIVASWKSNRPALAVETVGHADKQADSGDKADVAQQRAERVLKALSDAVWKRAVDVQQRMNWGRKSEGAKRPVSMNPGLNRRVEIFIQWGRVSRPALPACGHDIRNAVVIEREAARRTLSLSAEVAKRFIRTVGAVGSRGRFIPTVIDHKYWFAKLYEFTTFYEIGRISSFRYPAFILHFVPIFYDLYYRALENWTAGRRSLVSKPWQIHFTHASRSDNSSTTAWMLGVQRSIVTGTAAHVQGDMAVALEKAYRAYVAKYCLSPPPRFEEFRPDFFNMDTMIFKYSQAAFVLHVSHFGPGFAIGSKPGGIELGQFLFGIGARIMPGSLDIALVDQWRNIAWSEAKRRLGQ